MSSEITIEQAIDLGLATLPAMRKDNLQMTYGLNNCSLYNEFFSKADRTAGDGIEEFITLKDTGNGKMTSMWEEHTSNVVNTDSKITAAWVHFTTNLSYDRRELAMNMGNDVKIYDYFNGKMKNMFREAAEMLQVKLLLPPTSATDTKNPHGLTSWLTMGTDGSDGAFNGYTGKFNDGSGTAFNVGGISSSATDKPRWASFYADHEGKLGDNLVDLFCTAMRLTHFSPATLPRPYGKEETWGNFRIYTNNKVLRNLEALARATDDKIGGDITKYFGAVLVKGIPLVYLEELDTARTTVYGTDPIIGVNYDHFRAKVLAGNDFVVGKPRQRDNMPNVCTVDLDLSFASICDNRQLSGFLISQQ